MSKKPTLTTVASGYSSAATLQANLDALRDAFDNTISRDGSTPNTMIADLDLNNQDIINAKKLYVDSISISGSDIADSLTIAATGDVLLSTNNLDDVGSASTARTNLGLGDMAVQNKSAVDIDGGTIDSVTINNCTIGGTTAVGGIFGDIASLGPDPLTGNDIGGRVRLYAADDWDSVNEHYDILVDEDDFVVENAAGTKLLRYNRGEVNWNGINGRLIDSTIATSGSSTYTCNNDADYVLVHMIAGGGGGGSGDGDVTGGGDAGAGSGGNSGQEVTFIVWPASGVALNYSIGSGGVGSSTTANGTNGGNTTVSDGTTTFTAAGGEGGVSSHDETSVKTVLPSNRTPTSNPASSGIFHFNSDRAQEFGGVATIIPSVAVTGSGTASGGVGGSTTLGAGGRPGNSNINNNNDPGDDGDGYGAGGGGGACIGLSTVGVGGDGTGGYIKFEAWSKASVT